MCVHKMTQLFAQDSVINLTQTDFDGSKLKYDKCVCILFYNDSAESAKIMRDYKYIASSVSSPLFGIYYLPPPELIPNNTSLPVIVSYQNHELSRIYKNVMEITAITQFALLHACS